MLHILTLTYLCKLDVGKKGKMVHLLKQNSKIGIASKPRKQFKAYKPEANTKADEVVNLNTSF